MQFKNEADYNTLSVDCPPKDYTARSVPQAYRLVFEGIAIDDPKNWKSRYTKNPPKALKDFPDPKTRCLAMGLSLFNNKDGAVEHFTNLKENMGEKNFYRYLGNKLAKGSFNEKDGVSGFPDTKGHFTFHPSLEVDYTKFVAEIDL